MSDGPISREEMIALFGDEMPIEAVQLMWTADPEMTLGEIRAKLRKMAKPRGTMSDIVERLRAEGAGAFRKHYSLGMYKLCAEAAAEIERLRAALKPFAQWADREFVGAMPEDGPIVFGGPLKSDLTNARSVYQQSKDETCPACASKNWPSVNWKDGKSYEYCVDCGHERR